MPGLVSTGRAYVAATHSDQLESFQVAVCTAAGAREGLLYAQASCAYTVGYVDDARQLLELPEESLGHDAGIAGRAQQRGLGGIAATASAGGNDHKRARQETVEEALEEAHRGWSVYRMVEGRTMAAEVTRCLQTGLWRRRLGLSGRQAHGRITSSLVS